MPRRTRGAAPIALAIALSLAPASALAAACIAPNAGGTTPLPPLGCGLETPFGPLMIENGLPPATTIDIEIVELNLVCSNPVVCNGTLGAGICEEPGGSLGGDRECYESLFQLEVDGTGLLAGFNRTLFVPVVSHVETGPRTPGDPVQSFGANYLSLEGDLFGDPDFDFLSLRWGDAFGLPSPGLTTLTDLQDGTFNVDSFFDIEYRIDFQGAPGSILEGFSGTTQKNAKVQRGVPIANESTPALYGPWVTVMLGALLLTGVVWIQRRDPRQG